MTLLSVRFITDILMSESSEYLDFSEGSLAVGLMLKWTDLLDGHSTDSQVVKGRAIIIMNVNSPIDHTHIRLTRPYRRLLLQCKPRQSSVGQRQTFGRAQTLEGAYL